jgi:hypothetical protein
MQFTLRESLLFVLICAFVAIQSVHAEEPKHENKGPLLVYLLYHPEQHVPDPIQLIEGELLAFSLVRETPDPAAKFIQDEGTSCLEVRNSPNGQLLILRPLVDAPVRVNTNRDYEGLYVTADYLNTPPSLRFTKEPNKYSYWKLPDNGKGPIVNVSDFKKPAYLSIDSELINYNHDKGHYEFYRVTLSLDPKNHFK